MDALVLDAPAKTAHVQRVPIPEPANNELLVRVYAIALNPVDALYTANPLGKSGRIVGSDFAGVVEKRGPGPVASGSIEIGHRVAGFLQGACSVNDRPGAFAEFLTVPSDLVWRVPDEMTFEEAATISLCSLTAAQCLFYRLGLGAPFEWEVDSGVEALGSSSTSSSSPVEPVNVLIYGASTSVGLYAAQLLRMSDTLTNKKIRLLGTASSARHAQLQAEPYGYAELVDYRDEDWPRQISTFCGERGVTYALDCISEGSSVGMVGSTLGGTGRFAVLRSRNGGAWKGELSVEPIYGAVWEGLGETVQYQNIFIPPSPSARAFAVAFYRFLSKPPRGAKLHNNPVRYMPGGLAKVVDDGFALLGSGSMLDRHPRTESWMSPVNAEKLVYSLVNFQSSIGSR